MKKNKYCMENVLKESERKCKSGIFNDDIILWKVKNRNEMFVMLSTSRVQPN